MNYYIFTNHNTLSVKRIKELRDNFPTQDQIEENILSQFKKIKEGKDFDPIEVSLKPDIFDYAMREIKRKTHGKFDMQTIFIVPDDKHLPVVVFKKMEECTKEK